MKPRLGKPQPYKRKLHQRLVRRARQLPAQDVFPLKCSVLVHYNLYKTEINEVLLNSRIWSVFYCNSTFIHIGILKAWAASLPLHLIYSYEIAWVQLIMFKDTMLSQELSPHNRWYEWDRSPGPLHLGVAIGLSWGIANGYWVILFQTDNLEL